MWLLSIFYIGNRNSSITIRRCHSSPWYLVVIQFCCCYYFDYFHFYSMTKTDCYFLEFKIIRIDPLLKKWLSIFNSDEVRALIEDLAFSAVLEFSEFHYLVGFISLHSQLLYLNDCYIVLTRNLSVELVRSLTLFYISFLFFLNENFREQHKLWVFTTPVSNKNSRYFYSIGWCRQSDTIIWDSCEMLKCFYDRY